jgi:hypothetical protein
MSRLLSSIDALRRRLAAVVVAAEESLGGAPLSSLRAGPASASTASMPSPASASTNLAASLSRFTLLDSTVTAATPSANNASASQQQQQQQQQLMTTLVSVLYAAMERDASGPSGVALEERLSRFVVQIFPP